MSLVFPSEICSYFSSWQPHLPGWSSNSLKCIIRACQLFFPHSKFRIWHLSAPPVYHPLSKPPLSFRWTQWSPYPLRSLHGSKKGPFWAWVRLYHSFPQTPVHSPLVGIEAKPLLWLIYSPAHLPSCPYVFDFTYCSPHSLCSSHSAFSHRGPLHMLLLLSSMLCSQISAQCFILPFQVFVPTAPSQCSLDLLIRTQVPTLFSSHFVFSTVLSNTQYILFIVFSI